MYKLNLMLLINISYPDLLNEFFKAFGGESPINSVRTLNYLNSYIVKDSKGQLL